MNKPIDNQTKGLLFASGTALLWGFLAIALKIASKEVDPIAISWFRFSFAAAGLVLFLGKSNTGELKIFKAPPILAIIAGLGLCMNYVWYITGLHMTSPSNAQVIIQLAPVTLAFVGIIFLKEKMSKIQFGGFMLALFGFFLFYQNQLSIKMTDAISIYNQGSLFVVFGAASWVVYAVLQKLLVKKFNPQAINLIVYTTSAVVLLPFTDFSAFTDLSIGMWTLLVFLGFNTLIAYGFLGEAFKYADANKVGIVITLNPMITIFTMAILTLMDVSWIEPEYIDYMTVASALMVIFGAVLSVVAKKK